jgi:predicted nucleic acid-binding protein
MILADTSVWIDYFREDLPELGERLRRREVVMHPFVVGELACGNFYLPMPDLDLGQATQCRGGEHRNSRPTLTPIPDQFRRVAATRALPATAG